MRQLLVLLPHYYTCNLKANDSGLFSIYDVCFSEPTLMMIRMPHVTGAAFLVAVLSLGCGSSGDTLVHHVDKAAQEAAVRVVKQRGGKLVREGDSAEGAVTEVDLGGCPVVDSDLAELGAFQELKDLNLNGTKVTDAGMKDVGSLRELKSLALSKTRVADDGLSMLSGLTQLQALEMDETPITDKGVRHLARLEGLRNVYFNQTKLTGAGMKELAGLKDLRMVIMNDSDVNDSGLKDLAELKGLRNLNVSHTKVTRDGVAAFKRAVPECHVFAFPGD